MIYIEEMLSCVLSVCRKLLLHRHLERKAFAIRSLIGECFVNMSTLCSSHFILFHLTLFYILFYIMLFYIISYYFILFYITS